MAILTGDTPEDMRDRVWKDLYESLFKNLQAPTSEEMVRGLAVRRMSPIKGGEVIPAEVFFEPRPRGWAWERFKDWRDAAYEEARKGPVFIAWDLGVEQKPIRLPTEEDRAVHRAISAMQKPTRAHEP